MTDPTGVTGLADEPARVSVRGEDGIAVMRDTKKFDDGLLDRLTMPSTGTCLELCQAVAPQVGESPSRDGFRPSPARIPGS
jgi:hypothetical protein